AKNCYLCSRYVLSPMCPGRTQRGMAERVGFEPTVGFPLHSLSRRALSTAQTPLRGRCVIVTDGLVLHQCRNEPGSCLAGRKPPLCGALTNGVQQRRTG